MRSLMTSKPKSPRQTKLSLLFVGKYLLFLFIAVSIFGLVTIKDYLKNIAGNNKSVQSAQTNVTKNNSLKKTEVQINNSKLTVEVANTPSTRETGLSYRKSLDKDSGMLFVFDYASYPVFWMKDMNFPLDIIWINRNMVVDISEDLPFPKASTSLNELPTYEPKSAVNYVLEVNAGYVKENAIKIGDPVSINL